MACTAAPLAPLPRLSRRAIRMACWSLAKTKMSTRLVSLDGGDVEIAATRLQRCRVGQRHQADEAFTLEPLRKRALDRLAVAAGLELAEVQRHRHRQALVEVADDRHEQRLGGQPAVLLHFRHMLVLQRQRVGPRRRQARIAAALVLLDHLLAAARIAGDRSGRDRQRRGHDARVHQRAQQQDEGAGMAAGVGDALARTDARTLIGRQLGQAENPGRVRCGARCWRRSGRCAGCSRDNAASRAALSGRHRKATSAALSKRARSAASLRRSGSMLSTSTSLRCARYSWMRRPVVPSWPSTKTTCFIWISANRWLLHSIRHDGDGRSAWQALIGSLRR